MSDVEHQDAEFPISENFFLQVTMIKYKLGAPTMYIMRVEMFRKSQAVTEGYPHTSLGRWYVKKRFSEMYEVHQELMDKFGPRIVPEFPPKLWTQVLYATSDQADERMAGLQKYFSKLLVHPSVCACPEIQELFRVCPPEPPKEMKILSFVLNGDNNVCAICELGGDPGSLSSNAPAAANGKQPDRAKYGKPPLFFVIGIRRVVVIGYSSESMCFVREDKLENMGMKLQILVPLGPPGETYDLSVSSANYAGKHSEEKALQIRVMAPTMEDLIRQQQPGGPSSQQDEEDDENVALPVGDSNDSIANSEDNETTSEQKTSQNSESDQKPKHSHNSNEPSIKTLQDELSHAESEDAQPADKPSQSAGAIKKRDQKRAASSGKGSEKKNSKNSTSNSSNNGDNISNDGNNNENRSSQVSQCSSVVGFGPPRLSGSSDGSFKCDESDDGDSDEDGGAAQ